MIRIIQYLKRKATSQQNHMMQEHFIRMKLEDARKDPDLVQEMYNQLNVAFISEGSQIEYESSVSLGGRQFYISGTYDEWVSFFGVISLRQAQKANKRSSNTGKD